MTALQLNAELYRAMGYIAEDEGLMLKAVKYIKKLAAKKAAITKKAAEKKADSKADKKEEKEKK